MRSGGIVCFLEAFIHTCQPSCQNQMLTLNLYCHTYHIMTRHFSNGKLRTTHILYSYIFKLCLWTQKNVAINHALRLRGNYQLLKFFMVTSR